MTVPNYLGGMVEVYTNQVPYESDVLRTNLNLMIAISNLANSILGSGATSTPLVSGLACTPISPPGLSVVVGPGALYSMQDLLPTAYGNIYGPDTTTDHQQYKQCLLTDSATIATAAPAGVGNSIIYLIQCQAVNTQGNPSTSRPYYNSANPNVPTYLEAADTYVEVFTVEAKAGTASPVPTPPSPDAGWVPLYYVQVTHGQTTINSGDITVAANAPFITSNLSNKASITGVQYSSYIFSNDTGAANAYVATISPAASVYNTGLTIYLKIANSNSGASTINVNGLGLKNIVLPNNSPTIAGDLIANQIAILIFDGTSFQLQNPVTSAVSSVPVGSIFPYGAASAPAGFLLCDGSAVSRSTYASLFAVIGTTWGAGNGTTTFNIPSFIDKVPMGAGTNTLGTTVGANAHNISSGELPTHGHTFGGGAGHVPVSNEGWSTGANSGGGGGTNIAQTGGTATVSDATATDNAGSSTAMSLVQLSGVTQYIIKV